MNCTSSGHDRTWRSGAITILLLVVASQTYAQSSDSVEIQVALSACERVFQGAVPQITAGATTIPRQGVWVSHIVACVYNDPKFELVPAFIAYQRQHLSPTFDGDIVQPGEKVLLPTLTELTQTRIQAPVDYPPALQRDAEMMANRVQELKGGHLSDTEVRWCWLVVGMLSRESDADEIAQFIKKLTVEDIEDIQANWVAPLPDQWLEVRPDGKTVIHQYAR